MRLVRSRSRTKRLPIDEKLFTECPLLLHKRFGFRPRPKPRTTGDVIDGSMSAFLVDKLFIGEKDDVDTHALEGKGAIGVKAALFS